MKKLQAYPAGDDDGFTLIEMLLVLAIVAIMSGFTWASVEQSSPAADVKRAGDAVAIYLEKVRARALSDWQSYSVKFDRKQRAISSDAVADRLNWPENITLVAVTSEREASAREFNIRFNPDGSASGGNIRFKRKHSIYSVNVNWLTGQVVRRREF